eukprot:2832036-Amphidinium_carterae.1
MTVATPAIQEQLSSAIHQINVALRTQALASARMSGLQKALERHQTKLDRLSTRTLENSQTLSGIEAAMGAELVEVRRKFRAKKSELEVEALDLKQQKEST